MDFPTPNQPSLRLLSSELSDWKMAKQTGKKKSTERKKNSIKALKNPPSPESRSMIHSVQSALKKTRCTPCWRVCACVCVSVIFQAAAVCSFWNWRSKRDLWPRQLQTSPSRHLKTAAALFHHNTTISGGVRFWCARAHHSPSYFLQYRKNPHGCGCAPSSSID